MNTLRRTLLPALIERQDQLARSLFVRARNSAATHYRDADPDVLEIRCKNAVAAFCDSVKTSPTTFGDFFAAIAKERIEAGYQLHELQMLMNILEELLWQLCIDTLKDRDELVKALSVVSGTAGNAKDQIARVFLERSNHHLRRGAEVERLFDGT